MPANSTIGFARYQQQDTSGRPTNDLASIILFFSVIFIILLSVIFYLWITRWHKVPAQQRREEQVEDQKEIDQLVQNLKDQVKTIFRIPIVNMIYILFTKKQHQQSHEHRKVYAYKLYHLFSLVCIIVMLVSFIVLIGTVTSSSSSSQNNQGPSSFILQTFLFVFVLCVNLYLITRQRCYYKERKELFGSDDAHMHAVYKTRFKDWDSKMWTNWVQIAILIIEFFQLLVFPLRDLITVNLFNTNDNNDTSNNNNNNTNDNNNEEHGNFFDWVTIVMNAGGFMPDMRTPTWYTYSVWTVFTTSVLGLFIAVTVHCINIWRPYKIPTRWVHWCIPVTTLLYIPVLTTFVSSAACQTLNVQSNEFSNTLRCHSSDISQQLYLWTSLGGYIIAYFLLTIFLTSYERIPKHNEIAFKSISVAFIKNMGLFLAIVYLLVETTSQKNRMRAILSIMILLTMICYNIKARPCYVDKINYFRTASFSCILWTSVLVAVLSDTNAAAILGPLTVLCIIIGGWGLIIIIFLLIYFTYYKQPSDYCEDEYPPLPPTTITTNTTILSSPYYNNNNNNMFYDPRSKRSKEENYLDGDARRNTMLWSPTHQQGTSNDPRMIPLEPVVEETSNISGYQSTTHHTQKQQGEGFFGWATKWWIGSSSSLAPKK